jgi:hypothetical protein
VVAHASATVATLLPGRFFLGVGTGEHIVCRADVERRVEHIEEFHSAGFDHVHVHQVGADQERSSRSTSATCCRGSRCAEGRVRMPTTVDLEGVKRLLEEDAQLLDVLSGTEYEDSHLPGAIHIPLTELDARSAARLDRDRPVVAYCYDYQ